MFLYFVLGGIKELIISKIRIEKYYKRYSKIRSIEEKNTGLIS